MERLRGRPTPPGAAVVAGKTQDETLTSDLFPGIDSLRSPAVLCPYSAVPEEAATMRSNGQALAESAASAEGERGHNTPENSRTTETGGLFRIVRSISPERSTPRFTPAWLMLSGNSSRRWIAAERSETDCRREREGAARRRRSTDGPPPTGSAISTTLCISTRSSVSPSSNSSPTPSLCANAGSKRSSATCRATAFLTR